MFANERPCNDFSEVIGEAHAMSATGTGITGGDPMMDLDRTLAACRALKQEFGQEHHIHLYTSLPFDVAHANSLAEAGLDEIRFHLLDGFISCYSKFHRRKNNYRHPVIDAGHLHAINFVNGISRRQQGAAH